MEAYEQCYLGGGIYLAQKRLKQVFSQSVLGLTGHLGNGYLSIDFDSLINGFLFKRNILGNYDACLVSTKHELTNCIKKYIPEYNVEGIWPEFVLFLNLVESEIFNTRLTQISVDFDVFVLTGWLSNIPIFKREPFNVFKEHDYSNIIDFIKMPF